MMREAVIVDAVRTPIGKKRGALAGMRADELAAWPLRALLQRTGLPPAAVDDVIMGCVTQIAEQGWNIGRLAALLAGLPPETAGVSLNRMCGSSQQAIHYAAQAVIAGDADVVIAAGVESMSRVPMLSDGKDFSPLLAERYELVWQGESAERVADRWGLGRAELDAYALESHRRALAAAAAGRFAAEIAPVAVGPDGAEFSVDEGPRPDTSPAKLAELQPAFRPDGRVSAGNSSQISDGAAAVLITSREMAAEFGLKPRARISARTVVGVDPTLMLHGVIPATRKALQRARLSLADMDVIEVNEAFAPVVLAWQKELQVRDLERVNPCGGAIALGHPLGASGARIMATLLHELERRDGQFGLQTMCIGHGMATATVIEREPR